MKTNPLSLLKSEFAKNSLTLVSSSFIGQAIALLIYPLITRLFSQSDLGLYATWLSIVDVLTILSTGKYEDSILLSRNKEEAGATARVSMRINLWFSLAAVAVVAAVFVLGKADYTVFLIPPMIFFCGTTRVYQALFNYVKSFGQIAFSNISNSVAAAVAKLAAGFAHLTNGTLPAGSLVGQMVGNINYRIMLRKQGFPKTSWQQAKAMAARHRNFPLYSMPKNFIDSFSFNLPFLLLTGYFDKAYLGLFSLALTCTYRPIGFFANAYHNVLYKNISEKLLNKQSFRHQINRFVAGNAVVFVPVFVLGAIFAEPLIKLIFGNEWGECAPYLQILLPWIFVTLFVASLSFIPNLFSKQRTEMILNAILFAMRLVVLGVCIALHDFMLGIVLFAAVSLVMTIVMIAWYYSLVRRYEKTLN